jgi:ribosomal-protein-alanine acetyltransferase
MDEKFHATIRKFSPDDINKILIIEKQAFPKTAYSRQTFLNFLKHFPDTFIVIETGEDIVGYIMFDKSGHIHSTAVKPAFRMKGFGRMLFTHASKYAQKRPWLEVRSKNTGAIAFYKSMGMKITGRIPNYYQSDDALIMAMGREEEG